MIDADQAENGVHWLTATYQFNRFNPSRPEMSNGYTSKRSEPYWSNPPFLYYDIRTLWRSVLSARVSECQNIKNVVLDQYSTEIILPQSENPKSKG